MNINQSIYSKYNFNFHRSVRISVFVMNSNCSCQHCAADLSWPIISSKCNLLALNHFRLRADFNCPRVTSRKCLLNLWRHDRSTLIRWSVRACQRSGWGGYSFAIYRLACHCYYLWCVTMCPFKEFLLWFSVAAGCVRSSRGLWPGALFDGSLYVHRLTVNRCCQAIETSVACSPVNAAQTTSIQSANPLSQPRANFIRIACRAAADTLLTCRLFCRRRAVSGVRAWSHVMTATTSAV